MNFHFNTLDSCQGKRTCFVLLAGSFIPAWKQWSSQQLWRAVRKRALRVLASRECGIPMCLSINQTEPVQYHVDTSSAHQSSAFLGGIWSTTMQPRSSVQGSVLPFVPCNSLWHNKITASCQQYLNTQTDWKSISPPNKVCIVCQSCMRPDIIFSFVTSFSSMFIPAFVHFLRSREESSLVANNSYF